MGFIGKIFGAIFGIIGAVFSTLLGLVGLGKKSEYFVEAGDAQGMPASSPQPVMQSSAPATDTPSSNIASKAPESASATSSTPAPSPTVTTVAEAPAPATATPVSSFIPSENGKPVTGDTFAPDNLIKPVASVSRRRPGPSLSPFRDMARQVQTGA